MGKTLNNCHGIGHKKFKSKEESYADFKRIWSAYYVNIPPTLANACKYDQGGDCEKTWLPEVTWFYNHYDKYHK